ncbi:hypothetical protein QCD71_19300 [Sphingomonas sp. PsM26]|nr:hypothetical protein [Sphingomonas sp. PsM26]
MNAPNVPAATASQAAVSARSAGERRVVVAGAPAVAAPAMSAFLAVDVLLLVADAF